MQALPDKVIIKQATNRQRPGFGRGVACLNLCIDYSRVNETNPQWRLGLFSEDKVLFLFGLRVEFGIRCCARVLTSKARFERYQLSDTKPALAYGGRSS
jgi:hypothetical protein